jgi:hypothetical protein
LSGNSGRCRGIVDVVGEKVEQVGKNMQFALEIFVQSHSLSLSADFDLLNANLAWQPKLTCTCNNELQLCLSSVGSSIMMTPSFAGVDVDKWP